MKDYDLGNEFKGCKECHIRGRKRSKATEGICRAILKRPHQHTNKHGKIGLNRYRRCFYKDDEGIYCQEMTLGEFMNSVTWQMCLVDHALCELQNKKGMDL